MFWDKIDQKAASLLKKFRGSPLLKKYYLSGGTALALQLGHRISVDLDFFSREPASKVDFKKIMAELQKQFPNSIIAVQYRSIDQLWLELDGVKVTFLAFPFSRKYPLVNADGIPIANVKDIALQKAFAIGRRAKARDYVDLAWILKKKKATLEDISREAGETFIQDGEKLFSPRLFFQQLVYTEDLEDRDKVVRQLHGTYDFENLMKYIKDEVHHCGEKTFDPNFDPNKEKINPMSRKRVCTIRCQTSTAPVSTCRCVCGGKNHGIHAHKK